jgi:hypothetical protein
MGSDVAIPWEQGKRVNTAFLLLALTPIP